MKLKQFASLLVALLLMAALAIPAFAEPDEVQTIGEPTDDIAFTDSGMTAAPGFSIEPRLEEDDTQEQTFIAAMPYQTVPETTIGIVPINDDILLLAETEDGGLFSQRNTALAALCLSGFAVLLSIIALVRTRKKTAPNATGNYQKYF